MNEKQQYADTISDYATQAQYYGSGTAVFFGLTLNEIGLLVGIVVAVLGFFVNLYYRHRSQILIEKKHAIELEILRANNVTYFKPDDDGI
jgi:hypothetical protein